MVHILNRNEQRKGAIAEVALEGAPYDVGISSFAGGLEPGKGPNLHKHPYPETCVVHSGRAAMTVAGEVIVIGPGDIVVIEPEAPHRFVAVGHEKLVGLCIHASDRFIIDWLSEDSVAGSPGAR